MQPNKRIQQLQERLQSHATPQKKDWWERYLKHAIQFRGVPMASIRREVREWLPEENWVEMAVELLRQPLAEDKLARVPLLAEHVVPRKSIAGAELLLR